MPATFCNCKLHFIVASYTINKAEYSVLFSGKGLTEQLRLPVIIPVTNVPMKCIPPERRQLFGTKRKKVNCVDIFIAN